MMQLKGLGEHMLLRPHDIKLFRLRILLFEQKINLELQMFELGLFSFARQLLFYCRNVLLEKCDITVVPSLVIWTEG